MAASTQRGPRQSSERAVDGMCACDCRAALQPRAPAQHPGVAVRNSSSGTGFYVYSEALLQSAAALHACKGPEVLETKDAFESW